MDDGEDLLMLALDEELARLSRGLASIQARAGVLAAVTGISAGLVGDGADPGLLLIAAMFASATIFALVAVWPAPVSTPDVEAVWRDLPGLTREQALDHFRRAKLDRCIEFDEYISMRSRALQAGVIAGSVALTLLFMALVAAAVR
ncbi:hypothetical protein [Demequina sp. NBRC 110055]|uniref:hypothetical protein n=1 Tax=Demequina sp. NBRC 110055 TaxID=1570344 RepID=UPI000A01E298|nr:hypothetical protein [Demequina sp. NBRC 110055]